MQSRWWLLSCLLLALTGSLAAADKPRGLDLYYADTEGGAATLIVTPAGESILIDCGNPGKRDAQRIADLARKAGLEAIDHLIITHWHLDHYGGVEQLARLIPIRQFSDRGIPDTLPEDRGNFPVLIDAYKKASKGKSNALKPGDEVKLRQVPGGPPLRLRCVCGSGNTLPDQPGAPANPLARDHKALPEDRSDNGRSLGFILSFGDWRFLDLGDLTWNFEYRLVAPSDKLGRIDVYQVTHHGLEISNNPVLIRTVQPRVAICNNGPRKGGHPSVVATLRRVPDVQGIFQMHRNLNAGDAENTDADKIANDARKKQAGSSIHVAVAPDAKTYTVHVERTGKTFAYKTHGDQRP